MCIHVFVLSGPSGVVHGEKRVRGEARVSWHPSCQPVSSERSSRFCLVALLCQYVDRAYSAAASSQGTEGLSYLQKNTNDKFWRNVKWNSLFLFFFFLTWMMAPFSQMAETKKLMQLRRFAKGTGGLVFLTALSGTAGS